MDQIGESPRVLLEGFKPLVIIVEVLGILLIVLVCVWTETYRGGLAWTSQPGLEFNWHPLLMIAGLVYFYGNAMLIYRTQRNMRKRRLKLMHGSMMLLVVVFTVIALTAVFDSHNLQAVPIPNMYSLHSWVGLTTVILFCCQWLAGCLAFLYPGAQQNLRSSYMPIHVYFGTAGFIGAIASCLLGLNEKAIFSLGDKYSQFVGEGILINIMGLILILYGGVVVYLLSQDRYRRLPKPEDDALMPGRSQ